jgi:uncharacterized surface protein with fasciclin (FAS1) repeats
MNPSPPRLRSLLSGALALCFTAAATADNVVETLAERSEFSTLVTAVTEAGLVDALASAEDVTIFAPSNDAFAKIPEDDLNALLGNTEALTNLLLYHVVPESISYRSLESGPLDTLLEGQPVTVDVQKFFFGWYRIVSIDEARITRANINASNGVIHRINSVLDPDFEYKPTILEIAAGNPDFSILAGLVEQAGFARALDYDHANLTVFAPTNAAFEALGEETLEAVAGDRRLLRSILKNHIARGTLDSVALGEAGSVNTVLGLTLPIGPSDTSDTGLAVDGKPINAADIHASNGIVHVVGEVLAPPAPQSLVDVAVGRDDLNTFVAAVTAAGLVETFDSTRRWPSYTIFAPNDTAFENLPEGLLDDLLADPTGALTDVLSLHVVRGKLKARHLYDGQVLHSLSGERLTVEINDEGVTINGARVAVTDLTAENGVIHIMDDVIGSDPFTVADLMASSSYLSTLLAAVDAADLVGALDDPEADLTVFAPVNWAFNRLPDGTLDALLADPEGQLTQILLYHVVGESLDADELVDAGDVPTLQGSDVEVTSRSFYFWGWRSPFRIVKVNDARVFSADIETDNGIVHIISGVLLPPDDE